MAEHTKTPVMIDPVGSDALIHSASDRGEGAEVPERPDWMHARQKKTARSPESRKPPVKQESSLTPARAGAAAAELAIPERIKSWLRSGAAAGYGVSFFVHVLILLGMALWILPRLAESTSVTTVVPSDTEVPQPFDAMDDVHLEIPAGSDDVILPQLTEVNPQDAQLNLLEHQFLRDVTAAETKGEGGLSGQGGGFRLLEPKNAVKVGSFTAWTIPIAQKFGEQTKAGDPPRPGQDYHIVIQVKVPGDRQVYSINDLSGRVIGTDGYVQVIPAQAFIQEEDGRLTRAKLGRRLPIVDGVVQILIRVPGAEALVKDTIRVKSKQLKEQQTLELVFGGRN